MTFPDALGRLDRLQQTFGFKIVASGVLVAAAVTALVWYIVAINIPNPNAPETAPTPSAASADAAQPARRDRGPTGSPRSSGSAADAMIRAPTDLLETGRSTAVAIGVGIGSPSVSVSSGWAGLLRRSCWWAAVHLALLFGAGRPLYDAGAAPLSRSASS